jgi:hypothetical protein
MLPEEILLTSSQAKALWKFILKKREQPPPFLVIEGPGGTDRRALSTAIAVRDAMKLPRESVYVHPDPESLAPEKPDNDFVYDTVRRARSAIAA